MGMHIQVKGFLRTWDGVNDGNTNKLKPNFHVMCSRMRMATFWRWCQVDRSEFGAEKKHGGRRSRMLRVGRSLKSDTMPCHAGAEKPPEQPPAAPKELLGRIMQNQTGETGER